MSIIEKEIRFAYRHKPTKKWVNMYNIYDYDTVYRESVLCDNITDATLYSARNLLEKDFYESAFVFDSGKRNKKYIQENFYEFEVVKVEIQYNIIN